MPSKERRRHPQGSLSKEQTGVDIIPLKAGIFLQDFLGSCAMSKQSQDIRHREPYTRNDWLANHDLGIHNDPFYKILIVHRGSIEASLI